MLLYPRKTAILESTRPSNQGSANSQFQMPRFRKQPCKVKWVKTTTSVTGGGGPLNTPHGIIKMFLTD